MNSVYLKMLNEAYVERIPLNAQIELLNMCNMNCKHCYIPQHENMGLSTQKVKSLVNELQEMGMLNLVLTGGEIFLREDIFELIEYIRHKHISLTLLTNASLLNEDKIQRLSKYSIHSIGVSLYSLNVDIYNDITQTKEHFNKVLENLMLLKKYRIRVRINMPLMKLNYLYDEVKRFCINNGFSFRPSTIILPQTNGGNENLDLKLKDKEFMETNVKLFGDDRQEITDNSSDLLKKFPEDPCPSLKTSISIDCSGNVYPCNSMNLRVGNVYESSIKEILEGDTLNGIRNIKNQELKECAACDLKPYCSRCPGLIFAETKSLYGCCQSVRLMAIANKIVKEGSKTKEES